MIRRLQRKLVFGRGHGTGHGALIYKSYSYGDMFSEGLPSESMVASSDCMMAGLCKGDSPGCGVCHDSEIQREIVEIG